MPKEQDFEQAWLSKFSNAINDTAGKDVTKEVIQGSEELSSQSNRKEVIEWTRKAMIKLESLVGIERSREILTCCACQYPKSDLLEIRKKYEETNDIKLVHRMLQEKFESFLRDTLNLCDKLIEEIVKRRWGLAGVLKDNVIIATKIPKSGNLVEYMEETNPEMKRQYYCHCPRVRDILVNFESKESIPPLYCYCGAGFYKGIWEEILQKPVKVELLKSVLKGDEVCKIAIYLP